MSFKYFNNLKDFKYQINSIKNKLLCIYFTAMWCGPCKRVSPHFLSISNMSKYQDDCIFYKVDIDEHIDISTICNISSIPTFLILYNGDIIHEFSGIEKSDLIYNLEICIKRVKEMNNITQYIDDSSSDNEIITTIDNDIIDNDIDNTINKNSKASIKKNNSSENQETVNKKDKDSDIKNKMNNVLESLDKIKNTINTIKTTLTTLISKC